MGSAVWKKTNQVVEVVENRIGHFQFLSGNTLKIIAVFAMVIDHICKILLQWLLSNYWGPMISQGQLTFEQFQQIDSFIRFDLQSVGTIAFPLFCYLLSEGFRYTKNRKRYIGSMFLFALISEIPFDIGFFAEYAQKAGTFPCYLKYQNVFFTLFLGLLTLTGFEKLSAKSEKRIEKVKSAVLQVVCVVVFSLLAELIHCDYGMQGILFITAFYIGRKHRLFQILLFLLAYVGTTGDQLTLPILLACLLLLLYNGKRGRLHFKYFFYIFYPTHILILYLIQIALKEYLL